MAKNDSNNNNNSHSHSQRQQKQKRFVQQKQKQRRAPSSPSASAPPSSSSKSSPQCLLAFTLLLFTLLIAVIQTASAKSLLNDIDGNEPGFDAIDAHQHSWHQQAHQHHHQPHHRRRLQRRNIDSTAEGGAGQCESVRGYFESIAIKLNGFNAEKGSICNGHCCSNSTETQLRQKAKSDFERLLHHHTRSLRGMLESTANLFQNHIIELAQQSENKTLGVFSQVYRHMVPLSRKLIHELYAEIMSHLRITNGNVGGEGGVGAAGSINGDDATNSNNIIVTNTNSNSNNGIRNLKSLEEALHKFFVNLFPVAYHQAVHLSKENYGELHEDYNNCLKHTFDDLQPFGTIPKDIKRNLMQSIQTAQIFMSTLLQSAEVLSETNELYATHLTTQCQKQLLKMSYCPSCNGMQKSQVKTCYSYCMNVLRGCSAQYAGVLDSPWSNVVDAIDNLVTSHIRSDNGIVTTIKQLDTKLSEAIMRAMENGPELEKKVKKTCGVPKLLPSLAAEEIRPMAQHAIKFATPPDTEILRFLSTIDKSKEFYSNIVNNVCQDDDVQQNDHNCWTGDRIGDYNKMIMTPGFDTQKYNPEVPYETNSQSTKLNELMDKLIKIRKNIGTAVPAAARIHSDIQSDMARHDEEGSGHSMIDDGDDEEFDNLNGSGDGSGDDDPVTSSLPNTPFTPINHNDLESRSSSAGLTTIAATTTTKLTITTMIMCLLSTTTATLVTILLRSDS